MPWWPPAASGGASGRSPSRDRGWVATATRSAGTRHASATASATGLRAAESGRASRRPCGLGCGTRGCRASAVAVVDEATDRLDRRVRHGRSARTGRAVAHDTVFQAASLAKPVTALGVLALVDDGLIGLDDDVEPHLGLPLPRHRLAGAVPRGSVTVRRLLQHRGGIVGRGTTPTARGDRYRQRRRRVVPPPRPARRTAAGSGGLVVRPTGVGSGRAGDLPSGQPGELQRRRLPRAPTPDRAAVRSALRRVDGPAGSSRRSG